MATDQKFWCLFICIEYIEFVIHYLGAWQWFSQSELHPSPEQNATSVRAMFLETNDFLKRPHYHVWVLDTQAALGVLSTRPAQRLPLGTVVCVS